MRPWRRPILFDQRAGCLPAPACSAIELERLLRRWSRGGDAAHVTAHAVACNCTRCRGGPAHWHLCPPTSRPACALTGAPANRRRRAAPPGVRLFAVALIGLLAFLLHFPRSRRGRTCPRAPRRSIRASLGWIETGLRKSVRRRHGPATVIGEFLPRDGHGRQRLEGRGERKIRESGY